MAPQRPTSSQEKLQVLSREREGTGCTLPCCYFLNYFVSFPLKTMSPPAVMVFVLFMFPHRFDTWKPFTLLLHLNICVILFLSFISLHRKPEQRIRRHPSPWFGADWAWTQTTSEHGADRHQGEKWVHIQTLFFSSFFHSKRNISQHCRRICGEERGEECVCVDSSAATCYLHVYCVFPRQCDLRHRASHTPGVAAVSELLILNDTKPGEETNPHRWGIRRLRGCGGWGGGSSAWQS